MGMNGINYNRLVTGTKMMDAGKGGVEASDFDEGAWFAICAESAIAAAAGLVIIGAIRSYQEQKIAPGYGSKPDEGVDLVFDAKKPGDEAIFKSDFGGGDKIITYKGMAEGKAQFSILSKDNTVMEKQHIALFDYHRPETREEAIAQYQQLLHNSTDTVAVLDGKYGRQIVAWAEIENGNVKLNLAEGRLDFDRYWKELMK